MTHRARYRYDPASVAEARRFAESALAGLDPGLLDHVTLMVSELATNAVKHAQSGFRITIRRAKAAPIRVEVRDFGRGSPARRDPQPTEPNGRGLLIVQALSNSWGVEGHRRGKTVWFTISLAKTGLAGCTGSVAAG